MVLKVQKKSKAESSEYSIYNLLYTLNIIKYSLIILVGLIYKIDLHVYWFILQMNIN